MKMPKPNESSKAAFAKVVPDEPGIMLKPMFGQMSGFVNGNMFIGIFGDDLILRLPEDEIDRVKRSGGRDFEPMAGHKMGGYVVYAGAWQSKPPRELIKRALEHARKLPAKKPKPKKA
jgi:TfoX/Sxy family transcriptional regulator of competence genes